MSGATGYDPNSKMAEELTPFEAARQVHNGVVSKNGSSWDAMEAALRAFASAKPTSEMIQRSAEVLLADGCIEACQEFILAALPSTHANGGAEC